MVSLCHRSTRQMVSASDIYDIVSAAGPSIVFKEVYISEQFLCTSVYMDIFVEMLHRETICLVERWQSDTILRYFHTMSKRFTSGLGICMLQHGNYTPIPPTHAGI